MMELFPQDKIIAVYYKPWERNSITQV